MQYLGAKSICSRAMASAVPRLADPLESYQRGIISDACLCLAFRSELIKAEEYVGTSRSMLSV